MEERWGDVKVDVRGSSDKARAGGGSETLILVRHLGTPARSRQNPIKDRLSAESLTHALSPTMFLR